MDENWALTVLEVNADAWPLVTAADRQGGSATPGTRAVLVRLAAGYRGPGSATFDASARLVLLDSKLVAFPLSSSNCNAVPEPGLLSEQLVASGTSTEGFVCWILPESDADGLVVYDQRGPAVGRVFFGITQP